MKLRERGILFETGSPVRFPFKRGTTPAPNFGGLFQQDIEVAGLYMIRDLYPEADALPGWERGEWLFECPLVLPLNSDPKTERIYNRTSWKAALHDQYNASGEALRVALLDDGFDGVVTLGVSPRGEFYDTREIVALRIDPNKRTRP